MDYFVFVALYFHPYQTSAYRQSHTVLRFIFLRRHKYMPLNFYCNKQKALHYLHVEALIATATNNKELNTE